MTNAQYRLKLGPKIILTMFLIFTFLYAITAFVSGTFFLTYEQRLGIAIIWCILNLITSITYAIDHEQNPPKS